MSARLSIETDPHYLGVCLRITELNERSEVVRSLSVVYTPAIARQVAQDIQLEADKVEALGGPTQELQDVCKPADKRRGGS